MRALVIGAGGFVGRHLVSHLLEMGDDVVAASNTAAPAAHGVRPVSLDITDAPAVEGVLRDVRPEVVYHLAAIAFVPEAEADFSKTLSVNVTGTANIARSCRALGSVPALVFSSSSEVYGKVRPDELPVRETNEVRPANNYSLSKRMAELVIERYAREGLRCAVARPFNHIGPGQDPRFVVSNFALQLAKISKGLAPPVMEVGNLEARRDFSDVRDIVRAYRLMAQRDGGMWNLGSGQSRSIRQMLDALIAISGCAVEVRQDPARMRGPEMADLYGCIEAASASLGWRPEIPIGVSLEDAYRHWYESLA